MKRTSQKTYVLSVVFKTYDEYRLKAPATYAPKELRGGGFFILIVSKFTSKFEAMFPPNTEALGNE